MCVVRQIHLFTLTLVLMLLPCVASAQNESVIIEAESGIVGLQFEILTDPATGVQYASIVGTGAGGNPTTND
jgi:hypothetical protein